MSRGLLEDDLEWERCLQEAAFVHMPIQLRKLFCTICVFSNPSDPKALYEKFKESFLEDYIRDGHTPMVSINKCLKDFKLFFQQHGLMCKNFSLPEPIEDLNEKEEPLDLLKEAFIGKIYTLIFYENN